MEKRRFGRTGHDSSVAIFGGAAFWDVSQEQANESMDLVLSHGINHIDVAPSYGIAEERLGNWLVNHRDKFFLGCKTLERTREGAWAEMERSLEKLRTDHLDLYQLHCVSSWEELDQVCAKGNALEALDAAKSQKITQFAGITVHGLQAPEIILEALKRYDFDTVLFPLNAIMLSIEGYRYATQQLLVECKSKDVGVFTIKAAAKAPWGERAHSHTTWYEPYATSEDLQQAVNFALSHDITGICTAGDVTVLPVQLDACEKFSRLNPEEINARIAQSQGMAQIFK